MATDYLYVGTTILTTDADWIQTLVVVRTKNETEMNSPGCASSIDTTWRVSRYVENQT